MYRKMNQIIFKFTMLFLGFAAISFADPQTGTMTDSRDGKNYKTVTINNQVWMAENLNYEMSKSYCYEDKKSNCQKYGRLYEWSSAKSACPTGWRLPLYNEIKTLINEAGGEARAGDVLKSKSGWKPMENGYDNFGFKALPAGGGDVEGNFFEIGKRAYFWYSVKKSRDDTGHMELNSIGMGTMYPKASKKDVYSVRCVMDASNKSKTSEAMVGNHSERESLVSAQLGSLTDPRDEKKYKTVKIGEQTWMAENLNYEVNGSHCFENVSENCDKYGRFYTWDAAMTACPTGWHLPSESEWQMLLHDVGGEKQAGKMLKSTSNDWICGGSGVGLDAFGFSAVPTTGNMKDGKTDFWSSTEYMDNFAYELFLYCDFDEASLVFNEKKRELSVRCIKDSE